MKKNPVVALDVGPDPAEAFALFALHAGNVERVALILGVEVEVIEAMVVRWGWNKKVARTVGDSADAPAAQREVNRGVCYIQAHRLRSLVDAVLVELSDPEVFRDATTIVGVGGASRRDFRVLRDIADAARTSHDLTYRALGDSVDVARNDRAGRADGTAALDVMAAMDAADAAPSTSAVELVRRSLSAPA